MRKEFNGQSGKGGIYQIRNLETGKVYIGSAKCFQKRAAQHQQRLNTGKHHNKHLLSSWKKHGSDNFIFEVLEVLEGTKLERTTREQYYIDQYLDNWEMCYNLVKNCIQTHGKISNPEVFRRKISKAKKAFYKTKRGQEVIKLIADKKCGKTYEELYGKKRAKEIKEKIRKNKLVEMNRPEVKENLRKYRLGKTEVEIFGKEKAQEIAKKRSKARKGKFLKENSSRFRVIENIKLISPEGIEYNRIEGIKEFALKHHLSPNHLCELLHGKRKMHKGWKMSSSVSEALG